MGNGEHGRRRTIKKKMFLIPFPAASQVCPNSQTIPVLSATKAAEACTGQGKNESPLNPPEGDFFFYWLPYSKYRKTSSFQTITVDLMDNRLGCMDKLVTTKKTSCRQLTHKSKSTPVIAQDPQYYYSKEHKGNLTPQDCGG